MAQALDKVPFVVAFGDRLDETLECADLVFPVAHYLEQFDFPVNRMEGWVTGKHWYFAARQPAVDPPPGVHQTVDILIEWADRVGMLPALNERLNAKLVLAEGQKLQADRHYSNAEIVERRMLSMFGPDHDRRWFEEHGLVAWQRSMAERYPRALMKLPRMPVYFPHVRDRGRELKQVLDQLDLDWDISLYQSLPVWYGCWSHRTRRPEQLYAVNYKLPFETSTTTQGNPWLMDIAQRHRLAMYVTLNTRAARSRAIADGDVVELVGTNGYTTRGVAPVASLSPSAKA
ncbi:MAG: hypothetical protein HYY46_13075 [Deltaproteobacteria bacterium]|nr:hypothetical protein [Deltaproteobacteria bacterium]